jgi:hypothetical protein
VPLALGQRLLFRHLTHGGSALLVVVVLVLVVLAVRYWPAIAEDLEGRWRRRRRR